MGTSVILIISPLVSNRCLAQDNLLLLFKEAISMRDNRTSAISGARSFIERSPNVVGARQACTMQEIPSGCSLSAAAGALVAKAP